MAEETKVAGDAAGTQLGREGEHLDEAAILYAQHVRLFVIMLVAQLLVELNFMIMYVYYRKSALHNGS